MIAAPNRYALRLHDGGIVGAVRIDLIGQSRAGLRLVGIRSISSGKAMAASC